MKRPIQHQIDELAKRIFRNSLPASWAVNEHDTDYGKDFEVEIVDSQNEVTGVSFYVQLKGQQRTRGKSKKKFSLESKHARYYKRIEDVPAFLVLVNTETREPGGCLSRKASTMIRALILRKVPLLIFPATSA